MNYRSLLKNFEDLNKPGNVINETIPSRHDTIRLGEMFYLLKCNYKKKFIILVTMMKYFFSFSNISIQKKHFLALQKK